MLISHGATAVSASEGSSQEAVRVYIHTYVRTLQLQRTYMHNCVHLRGGAACSAEAPLQGCHLATNVQALCAASSAECKRSRIALSMHNRCWAVN